MAGQLCHGHQSTETNETPVSTVNEPPVFREASDELVNLRNVV